MKILIVYESMFGNTARVAHAVADGLADAGAESTVVDVGDLDVRVAGACDVLVLGGPTHGFSMSRASTREDAVRQGAHPDHGPAVGIREWLDGLLRVPEAPTFAAVFDTRVLKVRHLPGSAARRAAKMLRRHGLSVLDHPTSFYVTDLKGPLAEGEEDRARDWGRRLAELAGAPSAGVTSG